MITASGIVYWLLVVASLLSAAVVVFIRDVTRMALGLGVFLLSVAGWFLYFSHSFLAAAQLFVYVGGVLVLVLFALMLVHRSPEGIPALESRHGLDAALVSLSVFILVTVALQDVGPSLQGAPVPEGPQAISVQLLGAMLPHFEALGVLLLVALTAVIAISGGERR